MILIRVGDDEDEDEDEEVGLVDNNEEGSRDEDTIFLFGFSRLWVFLFVFCRFSVVDGHEVDCLFCFLEVFDTRFTDGLDGTYSVAEVSNKGEGLHGSIGTSPMANELAGFP